MTTVQQAGFTLIELMIVVLIVAIFITVGVPNFQNLIKDNRLSTQANRLVSSLQLARSEALKIRTPVSVCRSTDGTSCAGAGGTAGSWESGWLVFVDTDGDGTVDAGERIIQAHGELNSDNTLRAAAVPFNNVITYRATGLQSSGSGSFRLCDGNRPDAAQGRAITISTTGRVQSRKATAANPLTSCP